MAVRQKMDLPTKLWQSQQIDDPSSLISIAKLGKTVGLKGLMKCHLLTDFPETFNKECHFFAALPSLVKNSSFIPLTLNIFDFKKKLISFYEAPSIQEAKSLVNAILYTTLEDTQKFCQLQKEEFFWFDIIHSKVYDGEIFLGLVQDIHRIANTDYLFVKTDSKLQQTYAKEFLIPYIDAFIVMTDAKKKVILTKNTFALLEAS